MRLKYDPNWNVEYGHVTCNYCGRDIEGGSTRIADYHKTDCPTIRKGEEAMREALTYNFGIKEAEWVLKYGKAFLGAPVTLEALENEFPELYDEIRSRMSE